MNREALTETLRETLALFAESGVPRTTPEVADQLDLGRRATYGRLERLAERGRLETKKVGANARVWWRPQVDTGAVSPDWPAVADPPVDDVLDAVEVGIFVLDEEFDVAWINEATERYFGLDRGRVLGRDNRQLVDEHIASLVENSEAFTETVLATYDDSADTERFECHVTPDEDREERWLEHRSKPIESGAYAGGRVELYYDVTGRTGSELPRREERKEFASLVEAVEEYAIFTLDTEGYVRTWNPGARRIKGYEPDEIVGEHVATFYTEEDRVAGVPERNLAVAAEEGGVEDEGWRVRADGSRFWANVTITAIHDDDGDLRGYAKVTRDMTERRRSEAEHELLYETTQSIAEAETLDEGLQAALQDICEVTDWEYAEAWVPTDDGRLRRAEADYCVDDLTAFATFSEGITFDPGEGVPGRVWESGDVEWATDLPAGANTEYPRLDEALDAGLTSSLSVPVVTDGDVAGVLTFATRGDQQTDGRLVDLVTSVAADLGGLITRRRAEESLDRERKLIERIFETAPIGISVFGPDRELERANERMTEIIGSGPDDAATYTAGDPPLFDEHGEPLPLEERPVGRVFETGAPVVDQEVRVPGPDGSTRWVSANATPLTDADGHVSRVISTATDITQLKEQAERLERRREALEGELDDVFTRIDDAFYALDDEMRFEYVNDRAEELLGHSGAELLGRTVWEVLSVDADDPIRERFRRALDTREPVTFERFSDPLGIWETVRVYPSESGLSVYFTDITNRKEREQELEESRNQYQTLVENFPNGAVALVDADLRYLTVGGTPIEDADVTRDELVGSEVNDVLPDDLADLLVPRYGAALDGQASSFERSIADTTYQFHVLPVRDDDGEIFAAMGMSQDTTERRRYEERLRALYESSRELLEADTSSAISEALIETGERVLDLPGLVVYRYDAEQDRLVPETQSVEADFMREDSPAVVPDNSSITGHVFSSGESQYYENVLDSPHLQVSSDATEMRAGLFVPMDGEGILVAGSRDVDGIDTSTRQLVELLATNATTAYERVAREQEMVQQHEQLVALNSLNEVAREITSAVIDRSTREEIEQTVCEHLANSESYLFAWIGETDPATRTVNLRTEAGVEGYLDGATVSVDPTDERSKGPTGRALRTGETQVTYDIRADSRHDPWREYIEQYGFGSSAAIPIVHEGTVYGVLNVYAERPYAFRGDELAVISQLGEVAGHAIAATERKQALMSDEVVELEFQIRDVLTELDVPVEPGGTITLDHAVPVEDGEFLTYGTATPDAMETVTSLTETLPHWGAVTVRSEGDPTRFELRLTDPPILSVVASRGGYIESAVIEDGDFQMTIHLAPSVDVRQVIDAVEAEYPTVEMLRRRQISRDRDDFHRCNRHLVADLTDRQRTALEAAYHAGFFEWPRDASGEDVAESIGVAPPTFHQHLRKAERKAFDAVFSSAIQSAG